MDNTELVAAYIGVMRHELRLAPGVDALVELEARLTPPDSRQRPPARARGIARLAKALKRLRQHQPPVDSLEQFTEDLRFLRMFDNETAWTAEAIDDLMANVIAMPAPKSAPPRPTNTPPPSPASSPKSNVTPFRRKTPGPEDA